jgi:RNA polymerase sigma-70 factor (ECF subfamily)
MSVGLNIEDVGLREADDGDEGAFRALVEAQRAELHSHCYRMLGSLHDADDALQETLLRAWRALPCFHGRSSVRTWLYRIATNVCIDAIARRPRRVLPVDYGPPSQPELGQGNRRVPSRVWIEPYPDEALGVADGAAGPEARYERREALELAFVAALQHLPPRQRAALILRDVLGFSARETAKTLQTTEPSVNGALRRARATIDDRLLDPSQQVTLRALGDRRLQAIVERFADSFERGDVGAILELLTEDATFAMPPYPEWCRGRDAVAKSWLMPSGPPGSLRYAPARANGQLALGVYRIEPETGDSVPIALDVLALRADLVAEVTAFRDPSILGRFGLPLRFHEPAEAPAAMTERKSR